MTSTDQKPKHAIGRMFRQGNLVTRKFYLVVALFVAIVLCLLTLHRFEAYVLDSVRAYVAGEGFWSKGQKDAVYYLQRYGISHDESDYEEFLKGLAASLGDRQARLALQAMPPDIQRARQGFLAGRNHPDDVDQLVSFFLNFSEVSDMRQAIAIWTEGDALIDELQRLGLELHETVRTGKGHLSDIRDILSRISAVNVEVAGLEDRFSATLGNAARKYHNITQQIILAMTLLLLTLGIILARQIVRGIRQTQAKLEFSEARFRHVVESNIVGIMFWQSDGSITDANDAFLDITGYTREEMQAGKISCHALVSSERHAGLEILEEEIRNKGSCAPFEQEFMHKDGHRVTVYLGAARLEEAGDSRVCFALDISERKRAEQSQRLAAAVFHSASEAIFITDTTPAIKAVNPAFEKITGYSEEEVLGRNPNILSSGRSTSDFYRAMWESLTSKGGWKGEIWNRRRNGEIYQEWLSISAISNDKGEVSEYVAVFSDITEMRKLEEQLRQAQKMEAIGTLVGGIAHDFNNTLAAMEGNLFLAKEYNRGNKRLADKLTIIESLCMHSADMVEQLMTFARKGIVRMTHISLNEVFRRVGSLCASIMPENIALTVENCDDELVIEGDAAQLQQVMLHLLNNARDAVEGADSPAIGCRLTRFTPDAAFTEAHPELAASGALAHVEVSDNGCGIPDEQLEHIFEPFYTTKDIGKGTGLGLSMVYGAVQTHQGLVEVKSREGKGTTVHLYLPLAEVESQTTEEVRKVVTEAPGDGAITILLVDDNLNLRNVCAEILTSIGYEVLTADDGASALECFERHKEQIGLIISDVVMPVMGGFELAKRARQREEGLPVIFITGYDPEHVAIPGSLLEHSAILSKPFQVQALSELVRRLLAARQ